jgi:hypothetical protein
MAFREPDTRSSTYPPQSLDILLEVFRLISTLFDSLIADQVISAAVVSHPSRLVIPKDLHDLAGSQIPILFNTCEIDPQFPKVRSCSLRIETLCMRKRG